MSLIARCNGQSVFGDACTSGANLKNHFSPLAPPVQTEKTAFRPLHHRCKHFQKRFGPRVASVEVLCLHRTHVIYSPAANGSEEGARGPMSKPKTDWMRAPEPAFHAGNHQYTTHMVLSGLWDARTFALKLNTERKWQEFIRI